MMYLAVASVDLRSGHGISIWRGIRFVVVLVRLQVSLLVAFGL